MGTCPDISKWEELASGTLDGEAARELDSHLGGCAPCRAVREGMRRNDQLLGPLKAALKTGGAVSPRGEWMVGRRLGAYEICAVLGAGGMATVYEARQEHPHRTVALKIMAQGPGRAAAVERFEQEAEVLGRLQHPGIAQIYEAGVADTGMGPQPFLAMELVRGKRLTEHAADAGLGTRARLELMLKVCDAVQHAHQKGVIHRDLKPSNILVDERGEPKVLDFGVARVTDPDLRTAGVHTVSGQIVGTVAYMSPEQAGGDPDLVDTRSDVYALGVVCHELLTRRLPYEVVGKPLSEAVRVVRESAPTPLSRIDRSLRGDLETIVAKALEKDPARRYAGVGALAEDLRRFLGREPILARAPSAIYQLRKLVARHRAPVGAAAAGLAALVLGLAGTTYGLLKATSERNQAMIAQRDAETRRVEADRRRAEAEALARLLQDMLGAASPHQTKGHDYTVRQLLDDFAARLPGQLGDEPLVEAGIRATIGNAYRLLGEYPQAGEHLNRALELRRGALGDEHPLVAQSIDDHAWLLHDQADYDHAAAEFRQALELRRRLLGDLHADVAASMFGLSDVLRHAGVYEEAERAGRGSLDLRRRLAAGADTGDVAESLLNLSKLRWERSALDESERLCREAIEIWRRLHPEGHTSLADALNHLGWLRYLMGDSEGAERFCREALEMDRRLLGGKHPDVANSLYELGNVMAARGDHGAAEPLLREALEIYRAAHGDEHPAVATALDSLAASRRAQGDMVAAERLYCEALSLRWKLLGPAHPEVAQSLNNVALVLGATGEPEIAEAMYRGAIAIDRAAYGDGHAEMATALHNLAGLQRSRGDAAGAEASWREALAIFRRTYGEESFRVANVMSNLGMLRHDAGDRVGAEPLLEGALRIDRSVRGEAHAETLFTSANLGRLYAEEGRYREAELVARRALEAARKNAPTWRTGALLTALGLGLSGQGRHEDAEGALCEAFDLLREKLGAGNENTRAAARGLVGAYEAWGKPGQAEQVRALLNEGAGGGGR